uniref:Uncharacterized protein n=1 Tax=Arundo donax TaxID=35708 RepID=A0A0A8YDI8_ARUDO
MMSKVNGISCLVCHTIWFLTSLSHYYHRTVLNFHMTSIFSVLVDIFLRSWLFPSLLLY